MCNKCKILFKNIQDLRGSACVFVSTVIVFMPLVLQLYKKGKGATYPYWSVGGALISLP